jgi:hypothetical protein
MAGSGLLLVPSVSLGIVVDLDLRAARDVFLVVTGVLLLAWGRLAWSGRPRPEAFGTAVTRVVDRLVTAVGTFFAIALWAKYAPHASAAFARTVVLVLCGLGLMRGLLAAWHRSSRNSLVDGPEEPARANARHDPPGL